MTIPILIDAHVHLYPLHDAARFFEAAKRHLTAAVREIGVADDAMLVLAMTETARDSAFADLAAGRRTAPGWEVTICREDPTAFWVSDGTQTRILVVAGRQIISSERVEVLALATGLSFADGLPAADVLADLHAAQIPAILPWGMGKWMGRRGRIVSDLIARTANGGGVMIGDNGGRPVGWLQSRQFREAAALNVPIAPGSDPLPIDGAEDEAGRYGFAINGVLSEAQPGRDLSALLFALRGQPRLFGTRVNLPDAIRSQIALRRGKD